MPSQFRSGCVLTVDVLLDVSENIPSLIKIDDVRIRQIVNNFVSNAIKFTHEGFITVQAEFKQTTTGQGNLKITVSDTGIGMDEDAASRVFDQFEQADASTTREYGGTGLGLTICQELVRKMHGEIGVKSEVDVGSSFHIAVPVEIVEPAVELPSLDSRILIIDSFSQQCAVLKEYSTSAGIDVVTASTVFEASLLVEQMDEGNRDFDLVVVDSRIVMDQVHDAEQAYQKFPKLWDIPWVLMTEDYDAETIFYQDDRFSEHIRKPVRRDQFLSVLYKLLGDEELNDKITGAFDVGVDVLGSTLDEAIAKEQHILLVDDSPVNLIVAEQALEDMGCIVTSVANGREAVDAFASDTDYALTLMDCRMPVLDGYEATEEIRNLEGENNLPFTPVIALTAGALTKERQRCFDVGMNDFLSKPVRSEDLKRVVLKWLSKGQQEQKSKKKA